MALLKKTPLEKTSVKKVEPNAQVSASNNSFSNNPFEPAAPMQELLAFGDPMYTKVGNFRAQGVMSAENLDARAEELLREAKDAYTSVAAELTGVDPKNASTMWANAHVDPHLGRQASLNHGGRIGTSAVSTHVSDVAKKVDAQHAWAGQRPSPETYVSHLANAKSFVTSGDRDNIDGRTASVAQAVMEVYAHHQLQPSPLVAQQLQEFASTQISDYNPPRERREKLMEKFGELKTYPRADKSADRTKSIEGIMVRQSSKQPVEKSPVEQQPSAASGLQSKLDALSQEASKNSPSKDDGLSY